MGLVVPMMSGFLTVGFVTVISALLTMARLDIYKWLGYSNFVDVIFAILVIILLEGSFPGMVSAAFAGIVMSTLLWCLRNTLGYKKLKWVRCPWYKGCVRMKWIYYPPKWRNTINEALHGH